MGWLNRKKKIKTRITPSAMRKAIKGSGGNRKVIADRLGKTRAAVSFCLDKRPLVSKTWVKVRIAYDNECEALCDTAEKTIKDLVKQRDDIGEAGKNARWLLEKRRRGVYGDTKTVLVEGGDKPIQIVHKQIEIDYDKLPVHVQRELLKAAEATEVDKKLTPEEDAIGDPNDPEVQKVLKKMNSKRSSVTPAWAAAKKKKEKGK